MRTGLSVLPSWGCLGRWPNGFCSFFARGFGGLDLGGSGVGGGLGLGRCRVNGEKGSVLEATLCSALAWHGNVKTTSCLAMALHAARALVRDSSSEWLLHARAMRFLMVTSGSISSFQLGPNSFRARSTSSMNQARSLGCGLLMAPRRSVRRVRSSSTLGALDLRAMASRSRLPITSLAVRSRAASPSWTSARTYSHTRSHFLSSTGLL